MVVDRDQVVFVELLSDIERLTQWLRQRPNVDQVRVDRDVVRFVHRASRELQAELLDEIIQAGFRVVQFGSHTTSLEDVFMQVTEGKVQ